MKVENYNIKDLLKASHVKRWHTVDTVKSQSLAEHQWNVCMISTNLALSMGLNDKIISEIRDKALVHDMEEVWTGDMPSPYKESLKRTGGSPSYRDLGVPTPIATPSNEAEGEPPVRPEIHHNAIIDDVVAAADRVDAHFWSKKYVTDKSVQDDCADRLSHFMESCPVDLNQALGFLIEEYLKFK